jgi:hypothetical protein
MANTTTTGQQTPFSEITHPSRHRDVLVVITGSLLVTVLAGAGGPLLPVRNADSLLRMQSHHPSHNLTLNQDTTRGIAKVLYADAIAPRFDYQHAAPDRVRPVVDTTRGSSPWILLSAPVPSGKNWIASAPQKFWQHPDTTQAWPKQLFADASTPAQNVQQSAPERSRYVADTSRGALPAPPPAPALNPPGFTLRAPYAAIDTSQGSSQALITPPLPVGNASFIGVPWLIWQPADTSALSSRALLTPAPAPIIGPLHKGGDDAWRKRRREILAQPGDARERLRAQITLALEGPETELAREITAKYAAPGDAQGINLQELLSNIRDLRKILYAASQAAEARARDDDDDDVFLLM